MSTVTGSTGSTERTERTERMPQPPASARLRLSPRTRKLVLLTHIASAGAWLGIDLVLGVLVFTAFTATELQAAAAAVSLASFATWPLITVGVLTLVTGVLLGLGSRFGLVRYWWVLAKLVLNVVLVTLVALVLAPGTTALAGTALDALAEGTAPALPTTLMFPPIVSSMAVIIAMTVAVFKPWGRVGRAGAGNRRRNSRA